MIHLNHQCLLDHESIYLKNLIQLMQSLLFNNHNKCSLKPVLFLIQLQIFKLNGDLKRKPNITTQVIQYENLDYEMSAG